MPPQFPLLELPFLAELTALRRDIHAHPELAFAENRTADIVARELARYGLEVHRGMAKTGVVAWGPGCETAGEEAAVAGAEMGFAWADSASTVFAWAAAPVAGEPVAGAASTAEFS